MESRTGFSRLELMCVIIIVFVATAVFQAGANRSREHAKRMVCANNIRVNAEAIVSFAAEHDYRTPYSYAGGLWLHDVSSSYRNIIMSYGANPYTMFCPSDPGYNTYKNPDSIFWNQYSGWVISSYFWLTRNLSPSPYGSGSKQWVTTISVFRPNTTEMLTDVQFSDGLEPDSNYTWIIGGGSYVDYTNHRQGDRGCAGGNIGFVDMHVQWRPFAEMEYRWRASGGSPNPYQWW